MRRFLRSTIAVLCALSAGALFEVSVQGASALPYTSAAYDAQLAKVQADLQQSIVSSTGETKAIADVAPIVRCQIIFQNSLLEVDNRPLRSTLTRIGRPSAVSRRPETTRELIQQIALIRDGLKVQGPFDSASHASTALKIILRSREFGSDPIEPPSAINRKIDRLIDAIQRWFNRWLKKFHFPTAASPTELSVNPNIAKGILIGIGILAASFVINLLIRTFISLKRRRAVPARQGASFSALAMNEEEAALIASGEFDRLVILAKQNAALGYYRDGYRLVYLAALVLLDAALGVRLDRSWTNWEYLRRVEAAGHLEVHRLLDPLTSGFDRVWYGFSRADDRLFDEAASLYERIKASVHDVVPTGGRKTSG